MERTTLIKLRKDNRLTQKQVSEFVGINRSYYGFIENGQRNPRLEIAKKIANLFNVELEKIFPNEVFFAGKCYDMKRDDGIDLR